MQDIFLSIAPIFLLIVLGHGLRRCGIPSFEFWNLNDKLVYWVLMPALLFSKISAIHVESALVGAFAVVVLGGFAAAVAFALVSARLHGMAGPVASSLLQGAARHNTFIALAVAGRLFGPEGLALAAVGTALLIPITNVTVVALMVGLLRKPGEGSAVRAILRDLARNPLLLAVGAGALVNLGGTGTIPVVHEVADLLGRAALPIVLLCVGANIRFRGMAAALGPTVMSMLGKMAVFPAAILGLALALGLSPAETLVAALFGAAPTAASGYTLARQMGGDAPLMAAMITLQTVLALVTLPLTVALVQGLAGP
ncbi:MAG: AEC family transporter [Paracoccaceae bacterium]